MLTLPTLATSVVLSGIAFFGGVAPFTQTPPTSESVTECFEDMPCFDAHLEKENANDFASLEGDDGDEGESLSIMEEDAWDSYGKLELPPQTSESTFTDEWVGAWTGSVPEFDETYFKVASIKYPNTWHVFKVVELSKA